MSSLIASYSLTTVIVPLEPAKSRELREPAALMTIPAKRGSTATVPYVVQSTFSLTPITVYTTKNVKLAITVNLLLQLLHVRITYQRASTAPPLLSAQ